MLNKKNVIQEIRQAFHGNEIPGGPYLQPYPAGYKLSTVIIILIACIMPAITPTAFADTPPYKESLPCLPMTDPSYVDGNTKTLIKPPATEKQRIHLQQQLYLTDNTTRRFAITALAMAGDVKLLRELINTGDQYSLSSYVAYFRSKDKTRCLSDEVETIIADNLYTPAIGPTLLNIFRHNIYQSRSLALKLFSIAPGTPGYERHYLSVINALTATNRADIADQVLVHAKNRVNYYSKKHKQLPPTNELSAYLEFFTRQQHQPAISFFYSLVEMTNTAKMTEYVRSGFMDARVVIFKQAAKQPSELARVFLLKESIRLSNAELIPQVSNFELSALYVALLANNLDGAIDSEIISSIDAMLNKTRSRLKDSNFVHSIRYEMYQTLAKIHSAKAYDRLIIELVALNASPIFYETDLFMIVKLAAEMAARIEVDVSALLQQNPFPNDVYRNWPIVLMLKARLYPAGRAYLTQLLGKLDGQPFREKSYFNPIIDVLSDYDSDSMLQQTQREIDHLYQLGKLSPAEYEGLKIPFTAAELAVISTHQPLLNGVKRVFYDLKLPIKNKMLKIKRDSTPELRGYYQLANKQDFYLISTRQSNGPGGYMLVSRDTGDITNLCGKPVVSPDKHRLACTLLDLELGEMGNTIIVYNISKNGIYEEWQHHYPETIRTGPSKAHWKSNDTLEFEEIYYENNQLMTRQVELTYSQDQWLKKKIPTPLQQ